MFDHAKPAARRSFEDWNEEFQSTCKSELFASWDELCGDDDILRSAHANGDSPKEFVDRWAEKYNLDKRSDLVAEGVLSMEE